MSDDSEYISTRQAKRVRKSTMEWSLESTLALIRNIEKFENLWNPNCNNYKKRESTRLSWEAISKNLNVPQREAIFRWAAVRGNYQTHIRKEIENEGQFMGKTKHPNPLFTELKFLDPILNYESKIYISNTDTKNIKCDSMSTFETEFMQSTLPTKRKNPESPNLPTPIREMHSAPSSTTTKAQDDAQIFGDFIASAIRELPNKEKQYELKRIINRAVVDFQDENFPIY